MAVRLQRTAGATVKEVLFEEDSLQRLRVESDASEGLAVNYPPLTGNASVGDRILLNTTAVELSLGTGGVHFVIANLTRQPQPVERSGHIMKLRYTPHQTNVLTVEEEDHPDHHLISDFETLEGKPVLLGMLHSMIGPAIAGVRSFGEQAADPPVRIAYIMTDSAALPLAFSDLVRTFRSAGLLDITITCGQAFGGDRETVNLYTALAAASDCDALIVAPGPGHVGTGTRYGFSGIEMGNLIDIVSDMDGEPVLIPRVSYADPRDRHRGLSHHTITLLTEVCHCSATVVIPLLPGDQAEDLGHRLREYGIDREHEVVVEDGQPALAYLQDRDIEVKSMGRTPDKDPAFFLAAGAAGRYVGELMGS
ncbi:MAG: DUF3866 family protein [Armatimonadetes bacterium]|nr:DUF3866 family protein [Armatimonadota bacterium]